MPNSNHFPDGTLNHPNEVRFTKALLILHCAQPICRGVTRARSERHDQGLDNPTIADERST